ncbi:MAG: imelysin family protein [Bacteroidota bacterium]
MRTFRSILLLGLLTLLLYSCSRKGITKEEVVLNYAKVVAVSYDDSYRSALTMQTAIDQFLADPSQEGLEEAKAAWLAAREIYGQTEVYRETNSPIDVVQSENAPWGIANEAQMNAWPIDESYIDYTAKGTESHAGSYTSVIADTTLVITQEVLKNLNEKDTDKSISTGWHAIEFLLWGQDLSPPEEDKPGMRPYTDYTTAQEATRRAAYLQTATNLLVADLKQLMDTWSEGGPYRTVFENLDVDQALGQLVHGTFFMAGDELSSERMIAPVDSTDGVDGSGQEEEHSCFSDNTHRDIYVNMLGIQNVLFGTYDTIKGPSFYDLVRQSDPAQAAELKAVAGEAMARIQIIANNDRPFDYLITQESSSDTEFGPVMQSVVALQELGDQISVSGNAIGIDP